MSIDPRSIPVGHYTFYFADLQSNVIIDALPLRAVNYECLLNKAGAWNARLPLGDPRLLGAPPSNPFVWGQTRWGSGVWGLQHPTDLRAILATRPKQTCIYIDLDGVLQYGGVVWARDYDPTTNELLLSGADFWSLLKGQFIIADQVFAATDQLTIFSNLITYVQGLASASFGLSVVGTSSSGILRDRTYNGFEYKNAGDALEELAAVIDGFEFRAVPVWSGSTPVRQIQLGYPYLGQPSTNSSLIWSYPKGGIVKWSWPEDASPSTSASVAYAIGAGEGNAMLQATSPAGTPPFPRMGLVASYKDVSVQTTLQGHADAIQAALVDPVTVPQITVLGREVPLTGVYQPGDHARYVFDSEVDPRFWSGQDVIRRIVGKQVSIADDGTDQVVQILAPMVA